MARGAVFFPAFFAAPFAAVEAPAFRAALAGPVLAFVALVAVVAVVAVVVVSVVAPSEPPSLARKFCSRCSRSRRMTDASRRRELTTSAAACLLSSTKLPPQRVASSRSGSRRLSSCSATCLARPAAMPASAAAVWPRRFRSSSVPISRVYGGLPVNRRASRGHEPDAPRLVRLCCSVGG